jgi:hypothetical protein
LPFASPAGNFQFFRPRQGMGLSARRGCCFIDCKRFFYPLA